MEAQSRVLFYYRCLTSLSRGSQSMQNDHVEQALLAQKHTDAHLPMLVTSSPTGNVTAHSRKKW